MSLAKAQMHARSRAWVGAMCLQRLGVGIQPHDWAMLERVQATLPLNLYLGRYKATEATP